jgi:hypothetical protein
VDLRFEARVELGNEIGVVRRPYDAIGVAPAQPGAVDVLLPRFAKLVPLPVLAVGTVNFAGDAREAARATNA